MIDLEMLKRSGTAREKKHAERITPVCLWKKTCYAQF